MSLNQLLIEIGDRLSSRKFRLLACAAVRRLPIAAKGSGEQAIALAERFADSGISAHELAAARLAGRFLPGHPAWAVCWGPEEDAEGMARRALAWVAGQQGAGGNRVDYRNEEIEQAHLLREIAAHLFRPVVIDPAWLAWSDATVVRLARGIYDEGAFEQMPILGDALEEAGCADAIILDHCRQADGHVRGCWLLDLLMRKK